MKSLIVFILLTVLAGCLFRSSLIEKEFTLERVEDIERVFNPDFSLPSEILAFDFAQYHSEESNPLHNFAPNDYFAYMRIKVKPEDIDRWTFGLGEPYNNSGSFSTPWTPKTWWVSGNEFSKLNLYETKTYFKRYNGWLGVNKEAGYIYVHTFTM